MRRFAWAGVFALLLAAGCQGPAMYPANGGPYGAYPAATYGRGGGGYVAPPATYVPPTPAGAGSTASGPTPQSTPSLPPAGTLRAPVPESTSGSGF